jgi:hypothetical protein
VPRNTDRQDWATIAPTARRRSGIERFPATNRSKQRFPVATLGILPTGAGSSAT